MLHSPFTSLAGLASVATLTSMAAAADPVGAIVPIDIRGDHTPERVVAAVAGAELFLSVDAGPPVHAVRPWSWLADPDGPFVLGPDVDGDGVRELFVGGHDAVDGALLAAVDVVDGRVIAVLPRFHAGDPTRDLAAVLDSDADGDGTVGLGDLVELLALGDPFADRLTDRLAGVVAHWGARPDQLVPALGQAPLQCGNGPDCVPGPCPQCVGGICCRRADGTPCGICLDGGGKGSIGGAPGTGDQKSSAGPGGTGSPGTGFGLLIPGDAVPADPPCPRVVRARGADEPDPSRVAIGATVPIRIDAAPACAVRVRIDGPACFTDPGGACAGRTHESDDGTLPPIRVVGCGPIRILADTECRCDGTPAALELEAFAVDLHIDADNDDGRRPPRRTAEENAAEDALPGKIIFVTDADRDRDGIPAWADGIGRVEHAAGADEDLMLVPLDLQLPDPSVEGWRIRFEYDASAPSAVPAMPPTSWDGLAPPPGAFRLWMGDIDGPLDHRDYVNGGDFIVPGDWMEGPRLLGAGPLRLWLQAINPVADPDDAEAVRIRVEIDFIPAFPVEPGSPIDPECRTDDVHAVSVAIRAHDLQDWGIDLADGEPFLLDGDLTRPVPAGSQLNGAVADATSVCLLRAEPAIDLGPLGPLTLRVEHMNPDGPIARADLVGRVLPVHSRAPGDFELPRVPEPDLPAHVARVPFRHGLAFYVPPLGIGETPEASADVLVLPDDAEGPSNIPGCAPLSLALVGPDGQVLGAGMFRLRQPPVVLVHGILSSAADLAGAPLAAWDDRGIRITDWSNDETLGQVDAHLGFEENLGQVTWSIEQAIEGARGSDVRDVGGPVRYAAARADVVAHSQGGQIIRWYAAGLPDGATVARGGAWGDLPIRRFAGPPTRTEGRVAFLRPDNWGAGPVNRFVSVGSPFRGTNLASVAAGIFIPSPQAMEGLTAWRDDVQEPMPPPLAQLLWPDGPEGPYIAPTCISDLSVGSAAMAMLQPAPGGPARYPAGHRAVQWVAVGTRIIESDGTGSTVVSGLGASAGRGIWATRVVRAAGLLPPSVERILTFVRVTLAADGDHDSAVPIGSQLDESSADPRIGNRVVLDGVAHSKLLVPWDRTQLGSPTVDATVRALLRATRGGVVIDQNRRAPDAPVRFAPLEGTATP